MTPVAHELPTTRKHARGVDAFSPRWRALAKTMLPREFSYLSSSGSRRVSTYEFFAELVRTVWIAHQYDDNDKLVGAYAFAHWAFEQPRKDLWNAAGVSFFEHLFNSNIPPEVILPWISPSARKGAWGLWEFMLSKELFEAVAQISAQTRFVHQKEYDTALEKAESDMGKH